MENNFIEAVGMLAGACTTGAFFPQVVKTWKTRAVRDISLITFSFLTFGMAMWIAYGYLIGSESILIANIISIVFAGAILAMKVLFKDKPVAE